MNKDDLATEITEGTENNRGREQRVPARREATSNDKT